ncbi:succinate dehydrogenase, cytochrome b556 subunit [candidate division KSB1 bacterium]|nr:succinate dehydrogenase, cytochrome b556 subunit [candidate division KSB1 bacterium]
MLYKWKLGMITWVVHRVSGVLTALALILYIWVLSHFYSPAGPDRAMEVLKSPLFKWLSIGLLGVIIYHAMNGVRILLVDFGLEARYHKVLFWVLMGAGILIFLFGAYPFWLHALKA